MAIVESFDHLGPNFKMHVCAKFTRMILNSFCLMLIPAK